MTDFNMGEFLEFRGMVMEHNRNTNQLLQKIQSHLDRQDARKDQEHKAIWDGVRMHEAKDEAEFAQLNRQLNDIKNMIDTKLSFGKGFLSALAVISSVLGGAMALVSNKLFEILFR